MSEREPSGLKAASKGAGQPNHTAGMGEDSISSLLLRFSLPSTLAMMVMASYNIVDAVFVGQLGSDAIAALSIAFPIQMLIGAVAIGTGVGAASLISRSLGAEKAEDAAAAAGQVFFIALVLSFAITLVGLLFMEQILVLFGATPEILALTLEYMTVITNWVLLLFLIMMLNHTVRAEGNALLPMTVMIVSAVSNIVLDPIFIFVLGMGIKGAAVATVLAKVIGVAALLLYYLSGRSTLKLQLSHLRPEWKIITEIYKVGLPTMLTQMSHNISLIVANRILGAYGYVAIAVMGLVFRLQMFALMPVIGIAQGLLPIIGFNFGAKKYPRIREAMVRGFVAATVLVTVVGLAFFSFPAFFLGLFSNDESLLEVGTGALRIMVVMWPLLSLPLIGGSFFQAIGRGMPALTLSLMRQFIAYVPLLFLMPGLFGLTGVWLSAPLADMFTFLLSVVLVSREFNRRGISLAAGRR